jgi:Ser/Thr protein kinase RdoA (MazF antagonist)
MPKVPDLSPPTGAVTAERLAQRWFPGGATVEPLPTTGFSGCPVFRLRPCDGQPPHVLKAFAPAMSLGRARWVHAVAGHLRAAGTTAVPAPKPLAGGVDTLAATPDGRLWEAVSFIAGRPVDEPRPKQIAAAMWALAEIHAASATMPSDPPALAPARGLADRVGRARAMAGMPWQDLLGHGPATGGPLTAALVARLPPAAECFASHGGAALVRGLARLEPATLPCQVVLRDVWSDHVLFESAAAERVAGVIDLHAVGFDTPAADVARLLGSWLPAAPQVDPDWWSAAIAAYETVRPLGPEAERLVPWLAASGILFGLDHWFRWTLVEGRTFPETDPVTRRVDRLLARLPAALTTLRGMGPPPGLTGEKCSS